MKKLIVFSIILIFSTIIVESAMEYKLKQLKESQYLQEFKYLSIEKDNQKQILQKVNQELLSAIVQKINDNTITTNLNNQEFINEISSIQDQLKKPSFDNLKSHIVELYGKELVYNEKTKEHDIEEWMGTGFVIKETEKYTYIMSNKHVAGYGQPNVDMSIKTDDMKKSERLTVIGVCVDKDLSILRYEGHLINKTPISGFAECKEQDNVYVVGHHLGRLYIYGEGVVAGFEEEKRGDKDIFIMQLPTLFGNSGSPVFNKDEEVVGVVFAINPYNAFGSCDVAHALTVKAKDAKRFMEIIMAGE
jgi:S1-C subfamily serine protease